MCGIVGYVGQRPVQEILLAGLQKLEYRGYDSAGISIQSEGRLDSIRAVGNLSALRAAVADVARADFGGGVAVAAPPATTGIGHTRWATHGRVSEDNAHPHFDEDNRVHIVVNGIVENFMELKAELLADGVEFTSETDVEVMAHLIARELEQTGDLAEAVRVAYNRLRGHYALVAVAADDPGVIVGARKECPLIVGRGDGEQFLASGIPAFLAHTRDVQYIENDEIVVVRPGGVEFFTAAGVHVERPIETIDWDAEEAEKGGYETFMLKEIHEQADAVAETIADRTARPDGVDLPELDDELLRDCRRIVIVACGTSYHAGLIGRYALEEWARIPVEMDIASEYRYRNPIVGPGDLVVGITQSGETADTLAAMRLARERGAKVMALTNIMGSQATRDADTVLYTRAGLEMVFAATKTFTAQTAAMYLLGIWLAQSRDAWPQEKITEVVAELKGIPSKIGITLESVEERVRAIARSHADRPFFLYLGRNIGLPVCLEGALKMKEISYIPTDAYAAGEMKHGPIALLDESTPVVCVATNSPILEKMLSNMSEVKARGADVIAIATEGNAAVPEVADQTLYVPATDWILQPILAVLPLQLLAYHVARLKGLNVDQPRNLAKTVTVE